jgi:NAD(P)-dependent dehydrogenase (short-subunit alcohol dehydrogenase family)
VTGTTPRRAVVVGASSGVGRALAEALARDGADLVLAARSERDVDAVARDIAARFGVRAVTLPIDLRDHDDSLAAWFDRCVAALPEVDTVLVPAGIVDDADDGVSDPALFDALLGTNFVGVVHIVGRFVERFERAGHGTVVLFSSIAAGAPRRRNVAYTAAKAALESYARSLRHRCDGTGVEIQLYRLGYVDTAMTRGRRLLLPVAAAPRVATAVVRRLDRPRRSLYLPRFWAPVIFVLEHLPWSLYRRLEF